MEYKLSDYITAVGGRIIDRIVQNTAARLALTGVSTGIIVSESDTLDVFELTGTTASNAAHWTNRTSVADCTAAINAALTDIKNFGSGTLVFPRGIVQQFGATINVNMLGNEGFLRLLGTGDSALQFKGAAYKKWEVVNAEFFVAENMVFLGDTRVSNPFEATFAHFYIAAEKTIFKACGFYGLAIDNGADARGIVYGNKHVIIKDCKFGGCIARKGGVVRGQGTHQLLVENCKFIDYGNYRGFHYSKTPYGGPAWIYASDYLTQGTANDFAAVQVRDCFFDEGVGYAVHAKDIRKAYVEHCTVNTNPTGAGFHFENVGYAQAKNCWTGYTSNPAGLGLLATNCEVIEVLEHRNDAEVHAIKLAGTTKKAILKNCFLNQSSGNGVINDAGALLEIDGVKYKGAKAGYR